MSRTAWVELTDAQLLGQCAVDTYRASGPGGQKRNKTSSAVRLRHAPTGLVVIAEESRSQHENRAKALRRMRQALYLQIRDPAPETGVELLAIAAARNGEGRLSVSRKDARFWPAVGAALDAVFDCQARMSEAADRLGVTTANLVDFLRRDVKVWQRVNELRAAFGRKALR